MMSFTRAPFVTRLSIAVGSIFLSTMALAQHPVGPAPRPVAPVHVYAPPVYHAPVASTPVMRPPVMYNPIHSAPLSSAAPRSTIVLPPVRPIHPIRRFPPVILLYSPFYTSPFLFGGPFWGFNSCWDANCNWFGAWTIDSSNLSSPGPANYVLQASEMPIYVYGDERPDRPQLYLKDGTILNVTDYWVVDNQLHFKVVDETDGRAVEQTMPFDELDLQKTIDANTRRGFRFLLRNEPFDQYVRDHPDGPPPSAVAPQQ